MSTMEREACRQPGSRGHAGIAALAPLLVVVLAFQPSAAASAAPAQPSPLGIVLSKALVGGTSNPDQGWTNHTSALTPPAMAGAMMAYSTRDSAFVLFGGWNGLALSSTWILNPRTSTWREVHPAASPAPRGDGMLVYDEHENVFILFGGWGESPSGDHYRLGDTWAFYFGNETWIQRNPAVSPSPRSDSLVAYDSTDGVTLLVGGFDGSYLRDMWYYTFANDSWSPRPAPVTPSPRADGRMVYDAREARFFAFGGNDYNGPNLASHHLGDTWTYVWSRNIWTQIIPDVSPSPRDYSVFAHDSSSGELLLVGGYGNHTILGDIWAFNTTRVVWRNITVPGGPAPRFAAVGGYDPAEGVLVLFSGLADDGLKAETWYFHYPPPLLGELFVSSKDPIAGEALSFIANVRGGSGNLQASVWDFGDSNRAEGLSVTHRFSSPGVFGVRFSVRDDHGSLLSLSVDVPVGLWVPLWGDFLGLSVLFATPIVYISIKARLVRRKYMEATGKPASPGEKERPVVGPPTSGMDKLEVKEKEGSSTTPEAPND